VAPEHARAPLPWRWQPLAWRRAVPGQRGIVAIALVPTLFFAPLGELGIFRSWAEGASAILLLSILVIALGVTRDIGAPQPEEYWLFQKGCALDDWAVTRWLLALALGAAVAVWMMLGWTLAAYRNGYSPSPLFVGSITGWLIAVFAIVSVMLLALGATGRPRALDLAVITLLLTALFPAIGALLPSWAVVALRAALPPIAIAADLRSELTLGTPLRNLLPSGLHVVTWIALVLGLAVAMLRRRVPR